MQFVMIPCISKEEARRWACVISLMTFDYCKNLFVKVFTSKMLEDPLFIMKIWKIKEAYDIPSNSLSNEHPK